MNSNILFVANLPYSIDEAALDKLFLTFGNVLSSKIIKDRKTGQSKGYGFVEYAEDREAQGAMSALKGKVIFGRKIDVKVAKSK